MEQYLLSSRQNQAQQRHKIPLKSIRWMPSIVTIASIIIFPSDVVSFSLQPFCHCHGTRLHRHPSLTSLFASRPQNDDMTTASTKPFLQPRTTPQRGRQRRRRGQPTTTTTDATPIASDTTIATTATEPLSTVTAKIKRRNSSSARMTVGKSPSSLDFITEGMLSHPILEREEEYELATKVIQGEEVKQRLLALTEAKKDGKKKVVITLRDTVKTDAEIMELAAAVSDTIIEQLFSMVASKKDKNARCPTTDEQRTQILDILQEGQTSRNRLIECNLKLVTSIARKWLRQQSTSSFDLSDYRNNNNSMGGPAMEEVVQEGILGLMRAIEKYEPERKLRFSTYATYWITNYVRECFRNAKTGCLKVPAALHEIKATHGAILKRHHEHAMPPPTEHMIAKEIGVNVNRLRTALQYTRPLISIDQAITGSASSMKGSGAGGDAAGAGTGSDRGLILSDTLPCPEPRPEDCVQRSLLRQCLENAMASELSPHERDVLRLRLGLDDGKTRTVREVVEVCGGGVTLADVRSAERRAFKKLRSPHALHARDLASFLEECDVECDPFRR